MKPWLRLWLRAALLFGVLSMCLFGCKKEAEKVIGTDINGVVADNRGQPLADARVRLYTLTANEQFVKGSDILAGEAYIDRETVVASNNTERTERTGADGRVTFNALPNAFLAVADKPGCSAGFAGFNEETGVLNWDTLIKPSFTNGVHFDIPGFVLACAAPPEVGPEGNTPEAPPFEPPESTVTCDQTTCTAAGGTCDAGACIVACTPSLCAASGGTCDAGTCVLPLCNPVACSAAGGTCQQDECVLSACDSQACTAQGGTCVNDVCKTPACDPTACANAGGSCPADDGTCVIPACNPTTCTAAGGSCPPDGGTCVIPTCNEASCNDAGGTCDPDGGTCVIPTCNPAACSATGGSCPASGGACVIPACNSAACAAAGGSCPADGGTCVIPTCNQASCKDAGGTCNPDAGTCVIPPCLGKEAACKAARGACSADGTTCVIPPCFAGEATCTSAGGRCSSDGTTCLLPACKSDADCQAAQPGATCANPGNIDLAKCDPPLPDDIVPPIVAEGWTSFRITDTNDNLIADASSANQKVSASAIPEDGVVRIYGLYGGTTATQAFIQVQSGSGGCAHHRPRTDSIAVDLEDGVLGTETSNYVELPLHGGYQKIQLTTSEVLRQGERSFAVEFGERCGMPLHPFVAILSWDAGRRRPADLDLNVWNTSGDLVFLGNKQARWGWFRHHHGRGPGPEIFFSPDASQGPFTIKVQFFSGKPRPIRGKVRIIRVIAGDVLDQTFRFTVNRPKDVVEIGTFRTQ